MLNNWYLVYAYALLASFIMAAVLTAYLRRLAPKLGWVDHPGERKIHTNPIPVAGGIAIVATFYTVILANLLVLPIVRGLNLEWINQQIFEFLGEQHLYKLGGIFTGGLVIFALGFIDDLKALRPEIKLAGQIVAALILVASGIRLNLFIEVWWITVPLTVVWVVLITNSMNLLDNMDGLSGGVAVIAALSFFLCMLQGGQTFMCVMLMVFAGAVAGFLYHNLSPAKIFMGDAGAMFCGYFLAVVPILGTFYTEATPSRIAIAAPLLALSVPLFDTLSVMYIRWRKGESIMKGDKRHFSHRLVRFGMTRPQAVELIFLVAAINGLGAAILPQVQRTGTLLILMQAAGLFGLIILLMNVNPDTNEGE